MSMSFKPEVEKLIQKKVQEGPYRTASEVVIEALRLMDERDRMLALRREDIARQIDEGVESLRSGKGLDGEAFFDQMESELDSMEEHEQR